MHYKKAQGLNGGRRLYVWSDTISFSLTVKGKRFNKINKSHISSPATCKSLLWFRTITQTAGPCVEMSQFPSPYASPYQSPVLLMVILEIWCNTWQLVRVGHCKRLVWDQQWWEVYSNKTTYTITSLKSHNAKSSFVCLLYSCFCD